MAKRLSSVTRCHCSNSFEENDCENANTRAHVGLHIVVLAHFEKEVEFEGLREDGFGAFRENEVHFFYCAGGKIGEVAGHSPDAGLEAPDAVPVRPVSTQPGSVRVRHQTIRTGCSLERPVV